jgi:DNA-binding response OmpR family regulator
VPGNFSANGSVLILDSDPLTRTILHEVFGRAGYLADEAGDIGAAVERMKRDRPDLLILRPYISSMTGVMAAKFLRTRFPGTRVLIVGGFMADERIRAESEANDFQSFPTPFAIADLLEKVRQIFREIQAKRR